MGWGGNVIITIVVNHPFSIISHPSPIVHQHHHHHHILSYVHVYHANIKPLCAALEIHLSLVTRRIESKPQ